MAVARRIIDEPALVDNAKRFLEKHVKDDPLQASIYEMWSPLLDQAPESIARALLEDSERGAELRNTAPVFVVIRREELDFA